MNGSNIPGYIERALNQEEGYSKEFSDQIAKICKILSDQFDFQIHHDGDMNYRAGQSLSFSFLDRPPYTLSKKGYIHIKIFFSSRAELFCFVCIDERKIFTTSSNNEYFVPPESFPEPIQEVLKICRNILN